MHRRTSLLAFHKEYIGNLQGEFINLSEVTRGIFPCTPQMNTMLLLFNGLPGEGGGVLYKLGE